METMVTVAVSANGVRISKITAHGEEILEENTAVKALAVKLWQEVAKGALEGHAAVEPRIAELGSELSHLGAAVYSRLDGIERRLASLEQPVIRELKEMNQTGQPARHKSAQ